MSVVDIVLAGLNVDRSLREAISGDFIEGHARLAGTHGRRHADRWLWGQLLRSTPAFIQSAVSTRGLSLLRGVVGAAVVSMVVVSVTIGATASLLSATSVEIAGRAVLVMLAIDVAFGVAGGYLAAALGRSAPLAAAVVFGILAVVVTLFAGDQAGVSYQVTLQVLLLPATLAGGWIRARQLTRTRG